MPSSLIIGGGPAGAMAGVALAKRGWKVDLFEQHRFPRDKVCGECLSALGIGVLQRLLRPRRLHDAQPVILRRAMLHAPDGSSVELPLHSPMWGISRWVLDDWLLQCARESGVRVHQPSRCEKIEPGPSPAAQIRDLTTNRVETFTADWLVLADGKGALLGNRPRPTGDFGLKAHFTNVNGPRDAIELFGVIGRYGGVAPIESSRWNVAFSVSAVMLEQHRGNAAAVFAAMCRENARLADRFSSAHLASDWLVSPLPRFAVARSWPVGIIPLGNAAAALEPIGGEGMGLALRSAELAAEFLADKGGSSRDVSPLREDFNRLWRIRRAACRLAALGISTPALSGPAVDLLASNPRLSQTFLRLVGKEAQV